MPSVIAQAFNAAETVQIITAIGILIGIIGGVAANLFGIWRVERKADERAGVLSVVNTNTEVIKGHVNSEQTRLNAENDALRKERDFMRALLADQKEATALIAQERVSSETAKAITTAQEVAKGQVQLISEALRATPGEGNGS